MGINSYGATEFSDLRFAVSDANKVKELLSRSAGGAFAEVHSIVLADSAATVKGIGAAFAQVAQGAKSFRTGYPPIKCSTCTPAAGGPSSVQRAKYSTYFESPPGSGEFVHGLRAWDLYTDAEPPDWWRP